MGLARRRSNYATPIINEKTNKATVPSNAEWLDDGDNNGNNGDPDTNISTDTGTDTDNGTDTVSDTGGDADSDGGTTGEGLRLTGGIVPAGGTQMSSSFTLNGGLTQPSESTTVESASYTLELTRLQSKGVKNHHLISLAALLATMLWAGSALAQVPQTMTYQGHLTNRSGQPVACVIP